MVALPATADKLLGLDVSLGICDEISDVSSETFEALDLALGKRPGAKLVAVSSPGGDREGPLWKLVDYGRRHPESKSLWLREWAAPDGCKLDDERAWRAANPAIEAGFLDPEALRANLVTSREDSFRTYRLGQWVGSASSWLRWDQWEPLACNRVLQPNERLVCGFDGSASGDSTALVACTLDDDPYVAALACWENPGDVRWRVPRAEVLATIAEVLGRYDVVEFAADPWGWRSELETPADQYPRKVVQLPTNVVGRMGPATDRAYSLIAEGRLSHDGNADLARHVRNTVAKRTAAGDVPVKASKNSLKKIDLAVAMILAVERASWHRSRPKKPAGIYTF